MPVFRDNEGNHYDISDEDLSKYKVSGDLPEGTKLGGAQTDAAAGQRFDPGAPQYLWPPIDLLRRVVAELVGSVNVGQAAHNYPGGVAAGGPARAAYFWEGGSRPEAAAAGGGAAAYNYADPRAYNYADPRAYNYADQRAYNYADQRAYNYVPDARAYNYPGGGGGGNR